MGKKRKQPTISHTTRTPVTYQVNNQPSNESSNWLNLKNTVIGILGVVVTIGVALWLRKSPATQTASSFPVCETDDLQLKTFRPGQMSLLSERGHELLVYPYQDDNGHKISDPREYKNYKVAVDWLQEQPAIESYNAETFLGLIKTLHNKIVPGSGFYHDEFEYVLTEKNVGFFKGSLDDSLKLVSLVDSAGIETIRSITSKVNGIIKHYDVVVTDLGPSGVDASLQETIMVETCFTGKLQGESIPKKFQFTKAEKELIHRFYAFKPAVQEKDLLNKVGDILTTYKTDPVKAASDLHMLIVHKHPGTDGNGRTARAIANHLLRCAGQPVMIEPSQKSHYQVVRQAQDNGYQVFEEHLRGLIQPERIDAAKEVCLQLHAFQCHKRTHYDDCYDRVVRQQAASDEAAHKRDYRQSKQERLREVRKRH